MMDALLEIEINQVFVVIVVVFVAFLMMMIRADGTI